MPEAGAATELRATEPRANTANRPLPARALLPWRRAAAALGAGALHAVSFAPAGLPWLQMLALGALFWLALDAEGRRASRRAAALGWVFGLGWFGIGVSWVYISLHAYGDLAAPLSALATFALAALLSLFPAAALAAGVRGGPPRGPARAAALVAAWTLSEWLRGVVLSGFPWLAAGYAHTDGPLAGYAPLLGVYGVGAIAALCAVLGVLALRRALGSGRRPRAAALPLLLCAGLLAAGQALREPAWSRDEGRPIRVRLVQGAISQDLKFGEGSLERAEARYLPALQTRTAAAGGRVAPDLIVFPESAFPVPVNDLPQDVLQKLTDAGLRQGASLVFGAFVVEPPRRYFNSAIGLDGASGVPQRYSKRHLVPFGEFIPFGMHWFVQMLQIPIGDQEAGDEFQAPMRLSGQNIAVNICFEDLFGAEILAAWHDRRNQPNILLNLSNLAWFDDSIALPQHLQISRMRALETARPLLRATNTGVTAIIDSRGHVQEQLPTLAEGVLEGVVQGKSGNTPFTLYGNVPPVTLALLSWLACVATARRDPEPTPA
jgi:apolipoprotein N-acyltransferase